MFYAITPSKSYIEDADEELLAVCEKVRARAIKQAVYLDGWCGICSAALASAFIEMGRRAEIVIGTYWGEGHCWVEVDGLYYDITASQFGEPPIFISHQDDEYDQWFPEERISVINDETLAEYFAGWSEEQRPTERMIGRLLP